MDLAPQKWPSKCSQRNNEPLAGPTKKFLPKQYFTEPSGNELHISLYNDR